MKKRYRRVYAVQYLLVGLSLLATVGLIFLSMRVMEDRPYEDHFAIPWAAGRAWLLEGESPYGEGVIRQAEVELVNSSYAGQLPKSQALIEPILNLFFYLPFSLIPFRISRAIWVTVLAISVGLIGYFSLKLSGWKVTLLEKVILIALVVACFPSLKSVLTGQLSSIVILLLLVGVDAIRREKDTLAGFMLALTFGSFTTSALILLFLLIWSISRRRWSILTAYFSGLAFLWIVSLLLLPSWPMDWFRTLFAVYEGWDWVRTPLMDLSTVLPGIANYLSIALHAGFAVYLGVVGITLLGKSGREFTWKTLTLFVMAFLFNIQSSEYTLFLVLPALFLVFRFWSERWRIFGRIFSWVVMAMVAAGSWAAAAPDFSFVGEQRFEVLVVGLPLLVLAGMVSIRWWAVQIPRLPYENS